MGVIKKKYIIFWNVTTCSLVEVRRAAGYRLGDRGVGLRVPVVSRIVHFSTSSRSALRLTQPPIKWVPGVKRPGREAENLLQLCHGQESVNRPFPHATSMFVKHRDVPLLPFHLRISYA
jgi:hypothetical protein